MYAVVINYPSNLGLFTRTWKDGISDIKKAEEIRSRYLNTHSDSPQNVQVIQYDAP